ncbi:family 43 glycosylhydrolase [Bacteroides sp.]
MKRFYYLVAALLISAFVATTQAQITLADFEEPELDMLNVVTLDNVANGSYTVVANPATDGINTSTQCLLNNRKLVGWTDCTGKLYNSELNYAQVTDENRYLHIMVYAEEAASSLIFIRTGEKDDVWAYNAENKGTEIRFDFTPGKWKDVVVDLKGKVESVYGFYFLSQDWDVPNHERNFYYDEIVMNNDPLPRTAGFIDKAGVAADFEEGGSIPTFENTGNACAAINVVSNEDNEGLNKSEQTLLITTTTETNAEWWGGANITFGKPFLVTEQNRYLHIMIKTELENLEFNLFTGEENWYGNFTPQKDGWYDYVIDLIGGKFNLSGKLFTGFRALVNADKAVNRGKKLFLDEIILNDSSIPRIASTTEGPLKLHYTFDNYDGETVYDETGSYNATLKNSASIKELGQYHVLDLSNQNGYLDMGSWAGSLIATLSDFTVATYVYINENTDLASNGNFVFTFSNSTNIATEANGCLFYSARAQRYAISQTHWGGESGIEVGQQFAKGTWKHLTYVQQGGTGTLYVDGVAVKSGNITLSPKDLGSTAYNFIGRSPYVGDAYLKNTMLSDFRIYNTALSSDEISELSGSSLDGLKEAYSIQELIDAKNNLVINNGEEEVIQDILLPTFLSGSIEVNWTSSNEACISANGKVTRPAVGAEAQTVVLKATLSKGGKTQEREFTFKVLPLLDDAASVQKDLETLTANWEEVYIREKIILPSNGLEGSVITWQSNAPDYITDKGKVLQLPANGEGDKMVSMKATLTKGSVSKEQSFNLYIREDEGYTAYLFAYFIGNSGNEEALRFALSCDGYNYRALNSNNPIIDSGTISDTGGIRDPHILRGDDGYYYMVVTDMKSDNGWNSNHAIILLRSSDLINWTSGKVDIQAKYPAAFGDIQSAWAPQTIFDPEADKYMIYWSMRSPGTHEIIYYAYANSDFTDIEGEPQILFSHPDSKSTIDGDIIYKDGKYNLFFKTEGDGNGIKKAVSDRLTGGYVLQDKYLQQTDQDVEGSCVFRLINSDKYILMYDVYNNGRYEFTESTDLENFSSVDDSRVSMDFHPRHGTVIPVTAEEAERLMNQWGTLSNVDIFGSNSAKIRTRNIVKSNANLYLPAKYGTDLTGFEPELMVLPGVVVTPDTPQDFTSGAVAYTLSFKDETKVFNVTVQVDNNPVLDGYYADPEVLYSEKTNKFYIYPTTDGTPGWASSSFKTFSSDDLINWEDEGEILVLGKDVEWSDRNAWAPAIIEKKISEGYYKYYYYFTASQQVGVAVANDPTGPFLDSGKPLINSKPSGVTGGQEIDPDVFTDPVTSKSYIYWGNGYLAVAELNDDMVSVKEGTTRVITPSDNTFREGVYVFYREGRYYFFWSEDDTGSENYKVRYGVSSTPVGPISIPANNIVIQKNVAKQIYGTGHCSVLQMPGKDDEWYIVYHRFGRPRVDPSGYRREVCIDKLEFSADGSVVQTTPTLEGIGGSGTSVGLETMKSVDNKDNKLSFYPNPATDEIYVQGMDNGKLSIYNSLGAKVREQKIASDREKVNISDLPAGIYILSGEDSSNAIFSNILIKK